MKTKKSGYHPNSLLGKADKETRKRIKQGRYEANEDLRAMEQWASSGFKAGPDSNIAVQIGDDDGTE